MTLIREQVLRGRAKQTESEPILAIGNGETPDRHG